MTDEAISPLRRRMIEDMRIRKLAPQTRSHCRMQSRIDLFGEQRIRLIVQMPVGSL